MKREITELRHQESIANEIFAALATDRETSTVLQGLKSQEDLSSIANKIRKSQSWDVTGISSPNVRDESMSASSDMRYATTDVSSVHQGSESLLSSPSDSPAMQSRIHLNSEATLRPSPESIRTLRARACRGPTDLSDHRLIKHLFSIYWVWIHPSDMILDMQSFVDGYEMGIDIHCSMFLLYAVCIAACDYLSTGWENVEGKSTDVAILRQNLIASARMLETTADRKLETTRQALAILSLVHARPRNTLQNPLVNDKVHDDTLMSG